MEHMNDTLVPGITVIKGCGWFLLYLIPITGAILLNYFFPDRSDPYKKIFYDE